MTYDKYNDLDRQLKEYRLLQILANRNRQQLFYDYDRSTIVTNIGDPETDVSSSTESKNFFGNLWGSAKQTMSDLWNSINYDMDTQDVNAKIGDVADAKTYHEDLLKIKEYYNLLERKENLEDKIFNDPNMSTRSREELATLILLLDDVKESIAQFDSYFTGDGRTHDAIAQNMYDGTRLSMLERFNALTAETIKSGWSNHNIRLGLSKYGVLGSIVGGIVEGAADIVTRPVGVLDEILSGAYGEAKDIVKRIMSDEYSTSSRMQNYIKYLSKDDDEILKKSYVGGDLINRVNALKDIDNKILNAEHEYNETIDELKESQDNLKYGRLFGIGGAYDYNEVSKEWKQQRQWYEQEGGFIDGLLHPFLATLDIASSLDMMKYQIGAQGADVLIKKLTSAFLKNHPVIGTVLSAADVATGVGATIKSRQEETALEKIGAIGNRVANEAKANGGDIESIMRQIKEGGTLMGIDVDALTTDLLWLLGVALNIKTDDAAFEQAKKNAQLGINKLINANNALGILDYAQMLPYMSYSGDVTRGLKVFRDKTLDNLYVGEKTLGQRLNMRFDPNTYKHADYKSAIDQSLNLIDGYFSRKIKKAAETFLKRDMPKIALMGEHLAKYEGRKFRTLLATALSESVEEGVQNLLSSRYMRGEYDDYRKKQSMFDLSEFVSNPEIAATAIADYFGAGVWDPDNGSEDLVKSMNIGFWSSLIQSRGQHALTNLAGASDENIRGLARQFYDDKVAIRILAEQEKALLDNVHIDMFYDRFLHGADWSSLFTSLNDLKLMLSEDRGKQREGETAEQYQDRIELANRSLVKKEYIDDDIKLMTAVWGLYSNEQVSKELEEKGINKDSEKYRQFLRDGATALMDYHKTRELVLLQMKDINATQQYQEYILTKILDGSISQDELSQLVKDNSKLAAAIDKFSNNYDKYIKDFPKYTDREFLAYVGTIKTVDELIELVGKDVLLNNLDEDIKKQRTKKKGPKYKVLAQRLFEAKTDEAKRKRDELLRPIYEKESEDLFKERMLNENGREKNKSKKFSGHWAIRDLVKDKALAFDEGITAYLEDIFENDETERDRLIHEAYQRTKTPKTKALFALELLRMLHNLKKRKAIEDNMSWAIDQAQTLTKIRQITGLDVDPSKVQGWVDNYKKKLELLRSVEQDIVGKNSDFEKFLGGVFELDDDDTHTKTLLNYFINRAMMDALARVANIYMSLSENPNVLRLAIFGESATGTYLDDIVNEYGAVVAKKDSRRESDTHLGFDEITDLEDMQHLSKNAAWTAIEKKIEDSIQRKKIVHRRFQDAEEQLEFLNSTELLVLNGPDEDEPIVRSDETFDNTSDAEKAVRKQFYHDGGKKQDVKEELQKRKEAIKDKKEQDGDLDDVFDEFDSLSGGGPVETGKQGSGQTSTDNSGNDNTEADSKKQGSTNADDVNKVENDELDDEPGEVAHVDEGDIDTSNIDNAIEGSLEDDGANPYDSDILYEDTGVNNDLNDSENFEPAFEDDVQRTDEEVAEDAIEDDILDDYDTSFLSENEFGDIEYGGDPLNEDESDAIKEELDLIDEAENAPVHINNSTQTDNEENLGDIVGEPSPELIWQTLFYKYNEQKTPIILSVNGKVITEFNGKPLKPGAELSKKLSQKGWLHKVKSYYVVTQSLQAKNTKNNKDAFTVALILEDEDASYACVYKPIGDVISVSSKYKGRDGDPKVYHIHQREILKTSLLLHNMDIKKVIEYVGGIKKPETDKVLYEKQIEAAYKQAVNSYARELYALDYEQLHRDKKNAKQKAYSIWDSIQRAPSESIEDFEARKKQWDEIQDSYKYNARKYFSKPDRIVFKESKIDEEIDKLKKTRDEIIDAYLEKDDDGNYVFPNTPHIDKVRPEYLEQSNGKVDSLKTAGDLPIYRTLVDPSASMEEIQDMLEDESLLIGIGKGLRAKRTGKKFIVKYGFSRREGDDEVLFEKGGLSGKLYMMVHSLTGKNKIPIMLAEEKFDVQYRLTDGGKIEKVPINSSRRVKLCIDPITKKPIHGVKEKPSAAEVLLYMILGELNLPGIQSGNKQGRVQYDENELVSLFINCSMKTLLAKQPDPNSDLMVKLAAKQLYYGAKPVRVKKQTATGKTVVMWQQGTGEPMLYIGLPQETQIDVPRADGTTVKKNKTIYVQLEFSKNQILESQDDTEEVRQLKRQLREDIVQAIATLMHWNTDDYTFGESASVDASKSILGDLVQYLIQLEFEAGTFDKMTPVLIMDHRVSIMGCPQLSFRIGDFYSVPEGGATEFGDLVEQRGSVLAWMIKNGKIKTDASDQIFTAPFVFAHGVKSKTKDPVQKTAGGLSIPIQEAKGKKKNAKIEPEKTKQLPSTPDVLEESNVFYDEPKEKAQMSKISVRGLDKLNIPKTIAEVKEKIKKWVEFLRSSGANNKNFANRIDTDKNDVLDMVLLLGRDKLTICEFSEEHDDSGLGISEDDDEGLIEWDKKLREDLVDRFVEEYNKTHKDKLDRSSVENGTIKRYDKRTPDEVDVIFVYKEKETGKVKALVDTVDAYETEDAIPEELPFNLRHYTISAATGVFSRTKTKGKFDEKKAREWLSDKLGIDLANVVVWGAAEEALRDPEILGAVDVIVDSITDSLVGVIGLRKTGGRSIHYHEAWHYVNLLLHNEEERNYLYKAYLNTHKWFARKKPSNREIEERMAEDFRKWVLLLEDTSIVGSIRRGFANVLDFVRLFNKKKEYRLVFDDIIAGNYKQGRASLADLAYFKKEWREGAPFVKYYIPGTTEEQRQKKFEHISNHQQYFDASVAIAKRIIKDSNVHTEKDIKRVNGSNYDEMLKSVESWIDKSPDLSTQQKHILRDVMQNPELVKRAVQESFEELGLTAKIRTMKLVEKAEKGKLDKDDKVGVIDEAELKENAPADNTWDRFDLSISKRDNATIRTKLLMQQIPILKRKYNDDGVSFDYEEELDDFGMIKTYSFKEAWNLIVDRLWQCESLCDKDKDGYKKTSLLGMIDQRRKSNDFYESLWRILTTIDGNSWDAITLRSQIYTTINANRPQVSYLRIQDPLELIDDEDFSDDDSFDEGEIIRNGAVADVKREWSIKNDNEEEISRNIPREWSKTLTAHGLLEMNKRGETVLSKNFAKTLKNRLETVRQKLSKQYGAKELKLNINDIVNDVIDFYNMLSVPLDRDSLIVMIQLSSRKDDNISNRYIFNKLKSWFLYEDAKTTDDAGETVESVQNTLPKMADAIISAANSGANSVKYSGDERERQFDELLSNFREGTHIYKLAKAINIVHPSAKEFSIKSPNGDRIYPISLNSFISDRIRQLSITDGKFAKSMMEASKYCAVSQLLDISSKWAKQQKADTHFKLNAFVGIKDMNRPKGADYFGITPMEDYIAKLIMTEKDQIVLPTMADKKTWYSISHKNLKLCHDAILVIPYKDTLEKHIYLNYEKEKPKPTDKSQSVQLEWQVDAKAWYRGLDVNSEAKQKIDLDATEEYKKSNRSVLIMRYSDTTLNLFGKYMMGELNAVEQYYSRKNIKNLIENQARLIDNYHGKLYKTESGLTRIDFSGNGGRFRYFYDVITFTDKSGKKYNLNLRLQYLYELQKQIESGNAKNISKSDPLYNTIGSLALGEQNKLDGFELVREELKRIKNLHFKQGAFVSNEIKSSINEMLIGATKQELEKLSDENSPYKMVSKRNGKYIPNGIPTQLILSYANRISKALENKGVYFDTTQGLDETVAQDALFSLIANYVANQAISVIEFEKVFSGDPAFYSIKNAEKANRVKNKASLPKEGKAGVLYIAQDTGTAYKWNGTSYVKQNAEDVTTMQQITERIVLANGQTTESSIYVDVVNDNFSDKIKRLGSTLSPGDEMRLSYTEEELLKYPDLAITDYTNMNVEDINAQSMVIDHVSSIFERQLLVDHIRSIDKSKFEEYCKNNNLSFEKTIASIYDNDEVFKTIYDLYEDIKPKIKKELKSQLKPYNDITVCDALVFVRPSLYRKIRIGLGQWSYDDERAYQIIQGVGDKFKEGSNTGDWLADEKLYNAVRKLELFPLKMSYFQNDPSKFLGTAVPGLNKMAVFPLFKFQATTDTSRKLYERMNQKGDELDMISFKSAVKVGGHQNAVKMSKDGAAVSEQVCTIDELFNKKSAASIDYSRKDKKGEDNKNYGLVRRYYGDDFVPVQIQSLNNLRMQLNTEHHEEDFRNIGTQMFKLAFSNIIDDAEYDGKSGEFIKKDIMRIIKQLTSVGDEKLRKKYFKPGSDPDNPIPNDEELRKYIKLIIQNNGLGVAAEDIFDDGGVAASIMSREVFENSVTSLVNSEVVDIEMPGGTAIQQSIFGFVGHGNNKVRSLVGAYKINYNNGEELDWDMENGSMEIILSINFFRSVLPDDIKKKPFTEQKQWLIDHDIIKGRKTGGASFTDEELSIKKTLDELLPEDRTQYKNWSDETFKYLDNIGISRKYGGTINSIITRTILQDVPENIKKELELFLESKGVSFDTKYPEPTAKDGEMSNPEPFGMGYRIPTQGLSSMFAFTVADVMPPLVGDLIIVPREFTAQTGSDFDVDKLFLATYSYKNGQRERESDSGNTKGALTNSLLDHYITLITDIKNYANARASIDVLTSELKNDFVNGVIRNQPKKYLPGMFALTPSFLIDKKREFSIGKEGIAPFALNVTNLSLTQMCHLTMRYDGNISKYGFGDLDQMYGKDGRRIADWLSAMVNAHVDVAKDPYIFDLNVNHATYNYANFLLRAGMGMSTFTFLAQQSLKNIADEINNAGGIYGGNIDGSTPESLIYKRRRNQCIQHEYASVRNKLNGIRSRLIKKDGSVLSKEEQDRLNKLILYADYKSKNHNKNKKGGDAEKEPSFDYDRAKVFDEQIGKNQIQKGRSSDDVELIDYYEHQLACIRCFQEISEHAQAISSLVSASLIDTKKFGNTIKQMIDFRNKMDHVKEDGAVWTINDPDFDELFLDDNGKVDKKAAQREAIRRYFEDSYLEDKFTKSTKLIRNMLKSQLFTATKVFEDSFRWIFSHINGGDPELYEREYNADKIDAIGSAIDNIMRFNAMFNAGTMTLSELPEGSIDLTLGGNKQAVVENWKRILYGNDKTPPLYKRIAELQANLKNNKKKWDYFDLIDQKTGKVYNELLDILVPLSPNLKSPVGKITLITSLIDKDSQYKRKLISSFAQLLNSKSEGVKDIATDLVFYAYYSAYDQNTINSFFELVPPEYRKQYDLALSKTLSLLNSSDEEDIKQGMNIIYDNSSVSKMMDIISRNYWYDDNIVPRYYPGSYSSKYPFTSNNPVYGPSMVHGKEYGFPLYIAIDSNDNTVKHNDFFKVKIRRETLLYRKVGITLAKSVEDGKPAKKMSIYIPIPKAGLHQQNSHQFEFYADYETPSVFEDNRISTNFSHQAIRKEVQDLVDKVNSKKDRKFDVDIVWQDKEIPQTYDLFNRSTYLNLDTQQFKEIVNRVHLHPASETSGGKFKDPERECINAANVVLEINTTGTTEFKSYLEDNKTGISDDNLKKIITLNVDKPITKSDLDKIKTLLFDDSFVRRVHVKVTDKHNVQITQQDKDEYLRIIGTDSPTAKRLLKDSNSIEFAVKLYKINKYLLSLMNKVRAGKEDEIYMDASYYGNTTSAEAVQFVKLFSDSSISANVALSNYAQFKNPKLYDKLKWALDNRKEDYSIQSSTQAELLIESALKDNQSDLEKAVDMIDDTNDDIIDDSFEGSAMDLGDFDNEEKIPEQPAILKLIDETSRTNAENTKCDNNVSDSFDDFDAFD